MSRASVIQFKCPQNALGATTAVFDAFTIPSGGGLSYVPCVTGSWEGGFGDPPTSVTDTINGSPSGKTWQVFYFGATREAWIAYCFDHPGGSNIVVTATVANGNQRAYREGYGIVLEGQAGEPDPRSLAPVTATEPTTGALSFSFTRSGNGTLVAAATSVASLPGFTPTGGALLIDTLSTPANYGAGMYKAVSGASPQTITSTGGQATYLMNGIALAFNDPPSGGTAPTITDEPDPQTVTEGATANFTVAATGTGTLTYQWQVDTGSGFANVSNGTGGTTTSYTTIATTLAMDGYEYRCVVTGDTAPPATSTAALLTVNAASVAPTVTTDPVSQSVALGASVTLTVVATGTPTLTYQWRKNGGNISGANSSSYNIPSFAPSDAADYDVVVTNGAGSDTSAVATLTQASALGTIDLSGGEFEFVRKNQTRIATKNATFWVYNASGALVATVLASTNVNGVVGLLQHASIASSTLYEVEFEFEDGEYGVLYVTSEA